MSFNTFDRNQATDKERFDLLRDLTYLILERTTDTHFPTFYLLLCLKHVYSNMKTQLNHISTSLSSRGSQKYASYTTPNILYWRII